MKKYVISRVLQMIPLLLGVSLISFFIMHLAPGDPTNIFVNPNIDPKELIRVRANWGLDQPIYIQYFKWLFNAIQLNFGRSLMTGQPVINEIGERLPATLLLMISSMALTLLISIPAGVISAVKKNSWFDKFFTVFSFVGMSLPTFWLALMLMLFFSVQLDWLPAVGMFDPLIKDKNIIIRMHDVFLHMLLPLLTMTVLSLASITRYQRSAMLEVLNQDYIRTARAK
ncbi:MAG: ABC-type dipeptide/oligopeptide/nickel transport system permease component, partial [Candidatus Saganbacteria bacterium]